MSANDPRHGFVRAHRRRMQWCCNLSPKTIHSLTVPESLHNYDYDWLYLSQLGVAYKLGLHSCLLGVF